MPAWRIGRDAQSVVRSHRKSGSNVGRRARILGAAALPRRQGTPPGVPAALRWDDPGHDPPRRAARAPARAPVGRGRAFRRSGRRAPAGGARRRDARVPLRRRLGPVDLGGGGAPGVVAVRSRVLGDGVGGEEMAPSSWRWAGPRWRPTRAPAGSPWFQPTGAADSSSRRGPADGERSRRSRRPSGRTAPSPPWRAAGGRDAVTGQVVWRGGSQTGEVALTRAPCGLGAAGPGRTPPVVRDTRPVRVPYGIVAGATIAHSGPPLCSPVAHLDRAVATPSDAEAAPPRTGRRLDAWEDLAIWRDGCAHGGDGLIRR